MATTGELNLAPLVLMTALQEVIVIILEFD